MAKTVEVELVLSDDEYQKLAQAQQWLKDELGVSYLSMVETVDYALVDWLASHVFEEGGE